MKRLWPTALPLLLSLVVSATGSIGVAQVHYHDDGRPWSQRAGRGPDAEVPGWYYNLGVTGLRAELVAARPKTLTIRHVFAGSPADRKIRVGDVLTGAAGKPFQRFSSRTGTATAWTGSAPTARCSSSRARSRRAWTRDARASCS